MSAYFDNVFGQLENFSRDALLHGDGKSWDNRKKKGHRKYMPRGKVFMRIRSLEAQATIKAVNDFYEWADSVVKK